MQFFINGIYTTQENAHVSALNLGLLRGYGVFDYLRTYQNRPFHLQDHLDRLHYSAKELGLLIPYSHQEIREIVYTLLRNSPHEEHSVKIVVTGGCNQDLILPDSPETFLAFSKPLHSPEASCYAKGVKVTTTTQSRIIPRSKTTQYIGAIIALKESQKQGAIEALHLNDKKEILEGTTSNFFAFKNGVLLTPPEDAILLGITRAIVLKIAQNRFPIQIQPIAQQNLPYLDEAFITSSSKEVMPVTHIDNQPVRQGLVGPLTKQVMDLFSAYTRSHAWDPLQMGRYS